MWTWELTVIMPNNSNRRRITCLLSINQLDSVSRLPSRHVDLTIASAVSLLGIDWNRLGNHSVDAVRTGKILTCEEKLEV